MMNPISVALAIFLSGTFPALAQSNILTSGGTVISEGGLVSYSIGQVIQFTAEGERGSSATGIQNPYEVFVVTGLEIPSVDPFVSVYPNPASDVIILQINAGTFRSAECSLIDATGKELLHQTIFKPIHTFFLGDISPSFYLLKVRVAGKVRIFKIFKN